MKTIYIYEVLEETTRDTFNSYFYSKDEAERKAIRAYTSLTDRERKDTTIYVLCYGLDFADSTDTDYAAADLVTKLFNGDIECEDGFDTICGFSDDRQLSDMLEFPTPIAANLYNGNGTVYSTDDSGVQLDINYSGDDLICYTPCDDATGVYDSEEEAIQAYTDDITDELKDAFPYASEDSIEDIVRRIMIHAEATISSSWAAYDAEEDS